MKASTEAAPSATAVLVGDRADPHIQRVASELQTRGRPALVLNFGDVRAHPVTYDGDALTVRLGDRQIRVDHTATVWWRRVGMVDFEGLDPAEARLAADEIPHLVRGVVGALNCRVVDDPWSVERAEHKLVQQEVARRLELATPASCVTNDVAVARAFLEGRRVVAKPLSPGVGIAPYVDEVFDTDIELVASLPVLLQEMVVDATADLRVIVVGDHAWVWRRERAASTLDWRSSDPEGRDFRLNADDAVARASLQLAAALDLSMAVHDFLDTQHGPLYLETNPQGSWLFLERADELVIPALADHLVARQVNESQGHWPRALRRFAWDFLPSTRAPNNDGAIAPTFVDPEWINAVPATTSSLEIARRSHEDAREGAATAEAKATRTTQTALTLLTLALGLAAFQVSDLIDRPTIWLVALGPTLLAIGFLAISAFESVEVDRVGFYSTPKVEAVSGLGDVAALRRTIAADERGRRMASWTSRHKHSDLMQARAWMSRGLAALVLAGLIAVVLVATPQDGSSDPTTPTPTTTP